MVNFGTVFPLCYTCWLENVLGITLFLNNTKEYSDLCYIFFKMLPLCNCALLSATAHMLKTFLEAIL
jgi:hypothetical protein